MLLRRLHSGVVRFLANHATLCYRYAAWHSFSKGVHWCRYSLLTLCTSNAFCAYTVIYKLVCSICMQLSANVLSVSVCHQVFTTSNARLAHCLRCCAAGYNSLNGTLPTSLSSWRNVTLMSLESCSFTGAHCSSRPPTILAFLRGTASSISRRLKQQTQSHPVQPHTGGRGRAAPHFAV